MIDSGQKLSVTEKVGYGLGDSAANFIFQAMIIFQLSFYTDTFGISATAAGVMFLVVRVMDAFFDPLVGAIADRTKTRWGKFRPWILWTAIPYGILGFLAFSTPGFGGVGKLIYAYVTYTALNMIYSLNNTPYSALSGVMTGDLGERTGLSSYRFVFAMLGTFAIQAIGPEMLTYFGSTGGGHVNSAKGYEITMGIFAILSVIFFVITFLTTRERILPNPSQKSSIRQDIRDLTRNRPWIALFLLTIFLFIALMVRGSIMKYYFSYYLHREDLFGWFMGSGTAASIVGIFFSKPLAMRFGKRNVFIVGLSITTVLTAVFAVLPANMVALVFATEIVRQYFYGFTIPLLWAMMADVADYSEWKTGRATGMTFSAVVFGLKAGLGIGGAIVGGLLTIYHYRPNVAQTPDVLAGIRMISSVYAAIPFLISVILLFFYGINKQLNVQISDDLAKRREAFETSPPMVNGTILAEAP